MVGNAPFDKYANKIREIKNSDTDGVNGFLSVESKTIATSTSTTANIAYNKKCGIIDEKNKLWDTLEWHQRWVDNEYSATGLSKPIGIWIQALGIFVEVYWQTILPVGFSDITGTQSLAKSIFPHSPFYVECITTAMSDTAAAWPARVSGNIEHGTVGKYKSSYWKTQINGNGLDYFVYNTNEVFTIPSRSLDPAYAFIKNNADDFMWYNYTKCEFYRALCAICSGVETTSPDGTTTTVDILNSSGQQAAVNEDMYFWINGFNTGLLAKYNKTCKMYNGGRSIGQVLTDTIVDGIYNQQKANGVNMNDTGINSSTKPVLIEGCKGAEAIAVEGYWYIKTPYISNPSATVFNNINYNIPDDYPSYYCKNKGLRLLTPKELYAYYLNKPTVISGIVNLLRSTEGLSDYVPAIPTGNVWSAMNYNVQTGWYINMTNGLLSTNSTTSRYTIITGPSTTFKNT